MGRDWIKELAVKRVESYAISFIVFAFASGLAGGVFVVFGKFWWALLAFLFLPVIILGFQINNEWFNRQTEEVLKK